MSPLVDVSSPVPNSARATISLAFFGSGFLLASWVVHIPRVRTLLGLSDGELGLILWAATFGLLLGMTLGGWIVERFRSQRVTGFTLCCLGVATILTVISANRFALALALIPFGFLHGLIDVSMNSQAAAFEQRTGRAAMSSFHAFFSLGGLIGTLFGVALLAMRLSPFIQAPVTSLPFTIAGLFMYRGFIPEERREHGNGFFISFAQVIGLQSALLLVAGSLVLTLLVTRAGLGRQEGHSLQGRTPKAFGEPRSANGGSTLRAHFSRGRDKRGLGG